MTDKNTTDAAPATTAVVTTDTKDTLPIAAVRAQLHGDWSGVPEMDKVKYSVAMCKQLDIPTPLNPFKFIKMNGKEVLYATKELAELLAQRNKISVNILNKYLDREQNIYVVEVRAAQKDGRTFDNIAAMSMAGKAGDLRANLMMKCVSKAIRRVIFSAVGMSILDDDDIESMKNGTSYPTPPHMVAPLQMPQGVPATIEESDQAEETIQARAALISELCGERGARFYKNVAGAKKWVQELTGKPLETLSPNDVAEVFAALQEDEPEEMEPAEPKQIDISEVGNQKK